MEIGRERNGGGGEERRERGGKKRARLWAPARAEATSIRPSGWHGNTTLSPWWAPAVPRLGAICSRPGRRRARHRLLARTVGTSVRQRRPTPGPALSILLCAHWPIYSPLSEFCAATVYSPRCASRVLSYTRMPSRPFPTHVRRLHCLPTQQSVTVPPTARIHQSTIPSPAVASRTYLSSDPYPRARFPQGAGPDHTRRPGSGIPVLRPLHHPSVSSLHIDTQPWLRSGAHLSKNSEASPAGSSTLRSPAGPYPPTRWQGRLRTL